MACGNLKLYPELEPLTEKIQRHALWFQQYGVELRKKGGYKDYEVRFAWDVLRKVVTTFEICDWYDNYDRASELESIGYDVLSMSAKKWK